MRAPATTTLTIGKLHHLRHPGLIQLKGAGPPAVPPRRVLRRYELHTQHRLRVGLCQPLQLPLQRN